MEEVEEIVESIPFRKFIHPFTIYSFDNSELKGSVREKINGVSL